MLILKHNECLNFVMLYEIFEQILSTGSSLRYLIMKDNVNICKN